MGEQNGHTEANGFVVGDFPLRVRTHVNAGAGESGKSTIFKQMKILYGTSFSDDERKNISPSVCSNTIGSMKTLLQAAEDFDIEVAATVRCVVIHTSPKSATGYHRPVLK